LLLLLSITFFLKAISTTEIYTLSLHDALPIFAAVFAASAMGGVAFQEKVPVVIYKLCAVALAPGALGGLVGNYIGGINGNIVNRSEEHTSELQSRGHLVCRLLLEKKKRTRTC